LPCLHADVGERWLDVRWADIDISVGGHHRQLR